MDYHQNARLTIHSRELLARRVVDHGLTLKLAAASFNVSPKTAAKWVSRFREAGAAGLGDRSSRPHRSPRTTSSPLIEKVLALRRLRYNGRRIAHALGLSRATVSRILRRAGMNRLRSLDPPPPVVRYDGNASRGRAGNCGVSFGRRRYRKEAGGPSVGTFQGRTRPSRDRSVMRAPLEPD